MSFALVCALMRLTYLAVMSFYLYNGFVWACIHYIYTQLIVSEAHALAHKVFPVGQHASAPPSLTPCRMPFVSSTVIGFSGPHVCQEMDHVEKQSQQASLTPPPHTSVQSHSLTCCFTSDTNTWEKDGARSDHGKLLYCFDGFCFLTSSFS